MPRTSTPPRPPDQLHATVIQGPHVHHWADNRHLATPHALPKKLDFANLLEPNVQGFEIRFVGSAATMASSALMGKFPSYLDLMCYYDTP
jgi:hypothetical protein